MATATIVAVATLAVLGGSTGTPVVVDTYADQQPDSNIYGLEKAGESIKRALIGSPNNLELYQERMGEYQRMADEGKRPSTSRF